MNPMGLLGRMMGRGAAEAASDPAIAAARMQLKQSMPQAAAQIDRLPDDVIRQIMNNTTPGNPLQVARPSFAQPPQGVMGRRMGPY